MNTAVARWLLVALVSVTPFVLTGLLLNHVALFDSIGWTAIDVARALQGYALASITATYATGIVLDRAAPKIGLLISMALLVLGLLTPLAIPSASPGVLIYGALLGAAAGATSQRMMNMAVYPLRLVESSPIRRGFLPGAGKPKALAYLYPDEDRRLMSWQTVPLEYRLLWGFLSREGMREGEALALT